MAAYEIAVTLRVKDYFYSEKQAASSVSGLFGSFAEALPAFCEAVAFGYSVREDKLNAHLASYHKTAEETDRSYSLTLIRHEDGRDTDILENVRSDSCYDGEDTVVSCSGLSEEEIEELRLHGIEPEEDSFGSYFEVYPVNDLLYDFSDAADGALDPMQDGLRELLQEYAHAHGLLTNEIDPSEDGYLCPGSRSGSECFRKWGKIYGYADDEESIFTGSLVKYTHGFVMEFRE